MSRRFKPADRNDAARHRLRPEKREDRLADIEQAVTRALVSKPELGINDYEVDFVSRHQARWLPGNRDQNQR